MKILIDINHPAHVHYFRNFAGIMQNNGHDILFVSRDKEMAHRLLNLYNIGYIDRGKGKDGKLGKFLYLIYADFKLMRIAAEFKPDLFLNFLHPYPSQVAALLGKPSFVFSDTEHASLHHKLTVPFATKVFTPSCYRIDLGRKHVRFDGYMELAYLHPSYFTPDPSILELLGVQENERYVIVRFVSWAAAHDFDHAGMTLENKRKAVKAMSKHARVFITSENKLPADLEEFRIKIPFDKIHHAIYFSSLLFGESATMASEAAVLGTPSIYMDNDGRGYTDEEESKYGLVFNFTESEEDQQKAIDKAVSILEDKDSLIKYKKSRETLLENCVDTTQFMINEVLKYEPQPSVLTV
jgi:predicted glycosyltransferase